MVRSGSCLRMYVYCREALYKHQPQSMSSDEKICSDTRPRTSSAPRSEQFSSSYALGNLFASGNRHNVRGQITEHFFAKNGGYCVYYRLNIFRNSRGLEHWGISLRKNLLFTHLIRLDQSRPGKKKLMHYI